MPYVEPPASVKTRWVGIDEAGYGPNLGPLVMTAVIADGPSTGTRPDPWRELASAVCKAGEDPDRIWVDDSKRVHQLGRGYHRLETTTLAAIGGLRGQSPRSLGEALTAVSAGDFDATELRSWLHPTYDPVVPRFADRVFVREHCERRPFEGACWRLTMIRTVVVGPAAFNRVLDATGSKAAAHFSAFQALLKAIWSDASGPDEISVVADKHGGRHYYMQPLAETIDDCWIDRGPEGPELSQYQIRRRGRTLDLSFRPRADSADGLVALASIVSKTVREWWMEQFNAFWSRQLPGIAPTAGYPVDAARFRKEIEPTAEQLGLPPSSWWRVK